MFTCSLVLISCDISHDNGIEISRTYSRYWYRHIPKISLDTSRILDTIPNATSKQFRTHTWGYASLPPSWLYTAYTTAVVPAVLPPFRNSYPGSHGTHFSPFPTAVIAFVSVAKKKRSELVFLPWRPLASNWCTFMQPTSTIRTTQAVRRFLRSVRMLMFLFQALISTRTNTHVISSYNLLVVYIYM